MGCPSVKIVVHELVSCGARRLVRVGSCGSLYAREFGHGPAAELNRDYQQWIARVGAIASEMEASALFVMATAASADEVAPLSEPGRGVQAGCVHAVFGTHASDMKLDTSIVALAEERSIRVALEGVRAWHGV